MVEAARNQTEKGSGKEGNHDAEKIKVTQIFSIEKNYNLFLTVGTRKLN